ncbi:MAG TPA: hypothetical protein VFS05_11815, partial [Gemmatimonadaceae bacterium]|nr:hypothetical protein [Gemmatimonadaceae bacterium]
MTATGRRAPRPLPAMPLALGDVTVELVGRAAAPSAGAWTRADHGPWVRDLGEVRVSVEPRAAPEPRGLAWMELCIAATARRPVQVRHVAVELCAPCAAAPLAIDRELRWRPLAGTMVLNAGAPLVLRWREDGAMMELRSPRAAPCRAVRWSAGVLSLELVLDSAALHPRWSFVTNPHVSTSAPEWPAGRSVRTRLLLRRVDAGEEEIEPVVAARFPSGTEAALVLTDHSDYDTTERLLAFLDGHATERRRAKGWLGRGLRLTKGVFALPSTPPPPRVPAASLDDPAYCELVRRLCDEGSEIAPHGVNESGNVSVEQFREGLARLVRMFAPRTWIDHGMTLRYAYTMGGADGEYDLLRVLRSHGITTLWSYQDTPASAAGTLNMLAPAAGDARLLARHASRHLGRGSPLVAAHYLRSLARARMDGVVGQLVSASLSLLRHGYMTHASRAPKAGMLLAGLAALGGLRHARTWVRTVGSRPPEAPYSRGEALAMGAIVYPERAAPLADVTEGDMLLFATMEVLHTSDVYTPAAFERLVAERGVHIGHCYLLNRLPYLAGVFDAESDRDRLSPGWLAALDVMEAEVRAGRLWNPPVGELAEWMRAMQLMEMVPVDARAVELRNGTDATLAGYTILLPPDVSPSDVRWGAGAPAGARRWGDWLAVWG